MAGLTIASSRAFTHTMFALHYAHDYHLSTKNGQHGRLVLACAQAPDDGDFLYFSIGVGTSAQTADVGPSSRTMRRTCSAHGVLAFLFKTTQLVLGINVASGLI